LIKKQVVLRRLFQRADQYNPEMA